MELPNELSDKFSDELHLKMLLRLQQTFNRHKATENFALYARGVFETYSFILADIQEAQSNENEDS